MLETEHRKYDRCAAPEEAFARLQLGPESILGSIKNISKGGLLFEDIDKKIVTRIFRKDLKGK